MYIIGDVHGCYYTLLDLLDTLPDKQAQVYFVGDLIDRGKYSKQIVQLLIDRGYKSVMGNHEDMLIHYFKSRIDNYSWINYNGGYETLMSYDNVDKTYIHTLPNKHYDFIHNLPKHIIINGKLLISHSVIGKYETLEQSVKSNNILWNRGASNVPSGMFHIFGHTPVPRIILGENYANIDTGCIFGGSLSAAHWPSMDTYSVKINEKDITRWVQDE